MRRLQLRQHVGLELVRLLLRDDALLDERARVQLANSRMGRNRRGEEREVTMLPVPRLTPPGAALAAGLAPYAGDYFGKVLAEFSQDAARRAGDMMASAGEALGYEPGELSDLARKSERARLLTTTATLGAARTTWPPKVQALGRVLADGLIAEDKAKIDLTEMALAAMAEMDRPHVSLLELLVHHVPFEREDGWTSAPHRPDPSPQGGQSGSRAWEGEAILAIRPQLAPAFLGLIETLVRHALAFQVDQTAEAFGGFIRSQAAYQRRAAHRIERGQLAIPEDGPVIPSVPLQWAPTPFGEQVLDYYREAGAKTA